MIGRRVKSILLMADDDEDDRLMIKDALEEASFVNPVFFVEDGEELVDFLYRRGRYEREGGPPPRPGLILLDLNMPRKDGREALKEIKNDPEFRKIPVVILTTSKSEEDIFKSYDLGANSYIIKPDTFESLVEIMKDIKKYWFEIVELP